MEIEEFVKCMREGTCLCYQNVSALLGAGADPVAALEIIRYDDDEKPSEEYKVVLTTLQKEANWWRIKHFVVFLHTGAHSLLILQ